MPYGNTIKLGYPVFLCGHSKFGCYANRLEGCSLKFVGEYYIYYIQRLVQSL